DAMVNRGDLGTWLVQAGSINLAPGGAYLAGDANLDGAVDGSDFGVWNAFRFTNTPSWGAADFNADGIVDASDFNLWNSNKFRMAEVVAISVPEPGGRLFLLWLTFAALVVVKVGR